MENSGPHAPECPIPKDQLVVAMEAEAEMTRQDTYDVTVENFYKFGQTVDGEKMSVYINGYSTANNVRLMNVVKSDSQFVFFWVKK